MWHVGWNNQESLESEDQWSRERLESYSATNLTHSIEAWAHSESCQGIRDLARGSYKSAHVHTALFCEIKPAGLSDCQGILSQKCVNPLLLWQARMFSLGFSSHCRSLQSTNWKSTFLRCPTWTLKPANTSLYSECRALAWSQVLWSLTSTHWRRTQGHLRMMAVFPGHRISHDISCT